MTRPQSTRWPRSWAAPSVALLLWACAPESPVARLPTRPEATVETDPGPHYSPWVVTVGDRDARFDEISFKDVGMSSIDDTDRPETFHAIAESLASQLSESEASYSEAMSRPENHLSCAPRHVYVDLWASESPARWGYSLWSGCGEDDRFAWEELRRASSPDDADAIATLTEHIAGSLREAIETGCFTRQC